MRFKTPWNRNNFPDYQEPVDPVSLTIPDQSMSLQEILTRQARGLSLSDGRVPVYHADEDGEPLDLPDIAHLDLAERQQFLEDAKSEVDRIQRALNRQEFLKRAEDARKAAEQRSNVQRTTGDAAHQGKKDQPDNPISEKNRPAGEADTQSPQKGFGF